MIARNQTISADDLPLPDGGTEGWPWTAGAQARAAGNWPRITVVTPSYNQGQFIEETIRSVLLQGYPNLEYIIMDGGSSDGSQAILRRYEPFLAHLSIKKDDGQAAAIAEGFSLATGEILAWLNSDDLYMPGTLLRIADYFVTHPDCLFVVGDVQVIDEQSRPVGLVWGITPNLFLTSNSGLHGWPQPGAFWRREAYQTAGGLDPAMRFCMDRDLFIRICQQGKTAALPGLPVAAFRWQQDQKSQTINPIGRAENEILLARYGRRELKGLRPLLKMLWKAWARGDRFVRLAFHDIFT